MLEAFRMTPEHDSIQYSSAVMLLVRRCSCAVRSSLTRNLEVAIGVKPLDVSL